jgi:hypothetical protein
VEERKMSRLERFMAKPVTLTLDGEDFEIHPLTIKHMDVMMSAASENAKEKADAFAKMMTVTLKKAVPDATPEELDGFSMKYFQELTEAILTANGFGDDAKQLKVKSTEIKGKE